MLRHVQLHRRKGHQGRHAEGGTRSPEATGEYCRQQKSEDAEYSRDGFETVQRFGPKYFVPEVGKENIEKTDRRQN